MTVTPFDYEGQPLRAYATTAGDIEFVAADAATILGHRMASDMLRTLDEDEKGTRLMRTPGGDQNLTTVTEAGLYRAILLRQTGRMVDEATKTTVKRFQRWVSHEVLPSIRRNGTYRSAPDMSGLAPEGLEYLAQVGAALSAAVEIAKRNQHKADAYDDFLNGVGCYSVGTVGRMLGIGSQTMFNFLYAEKILISSGRRKREPYSNPKLKGWFAVKAYDQANTNGHASTWTGVTPLGAEKIRLLAIERGLIQPHLIALPAVPGAMAVAS